MRHAGVPRPNTAVVGPVLCQQLKEAIASGEVQAATRPDTQTVAQVRLRLGQAALLPPDKEVSKRQFSRLRKSAIRRAWLPPAIVLPPDTGNNTLRQTPTALL